MVETYSQAIQDIVSVGTSSTAVVAANHSREYLVNDSDTNIYLKLGQTAVVSEGVRLNANGGSYEMSQKFGNVYCGAINAIHGGTGSKRILVLEGV